MLIEVTERLPQLDPSRRGRRWQLWMVTGSILLHILFVGAVVFAPGLWPAGQRPVEQAIPVEIVQEDPPPPPQHEPQPPQQREFLDRATNYAENPKAVNQDEAPGRPEEAHQSADVIVESDPGEGARLALEKKKSEAIVASNTLEDGTQAGGRLGALLRAQIGPCWAQSASAWSKIKDIEQLRVYIEVDLRSDGTLKLEPEVFGKDGITSRNEVVADVVANGARDAIRACAPYRFPREIYEDWKALKLVFLLN